MDNKNKKVLFHNKRKFRVYKKGQVVYVDFGHQPPGVQGGIRPSVVVSRNESNHSYAPQITVCPLSSKLKDKRVHVRLQKNDVNGGHLKNESDVLTEDMQTVAKSAVRGSVGYVCEEKMKELDYALVLQLGLISVTAFDGMCLVTRLGYPAPVVYLSFFEPACPFRTWER